MVYMAMHYVLIFHAALALLVPLLSLKRDKGLPQGLCSVWNTPTKGAQVDPTSLSSNKSV